MERERRWMVGAMLVMSMAGGAVANALLPARLVAQGGDVVTASQVNIVDAAGRLRAVLSGDDALGLTSLTFYGPDGATRGTLGMDAGGAPGLRFMDAGGAVQLAASVSEVEALVTVGDQRARSAVFGSFNGTPVVGLSHAGQARMQFELGPAGQPSVSLQGEPSVNLLGQPGQQALSLSVDADGAPFVSLYDAAGAPRILMGAVQGTAVVNLGDGIQPRMVLGVTDQGEGSLGFYDADGELVRLEGAEPSP